jgi:hypothetical protein
VLDGTLARPGCVLKEVANGRIVGHLKELAGLERALSLFPLNPLLSGASAVAQFGRWAETHAQLKHIQDMLTRLQLVGGVGALASAAGLGVSVAGFAVVLRRLERLEQNLNQALDRLRADVERLHLKLDMLQMAELRAAWEQLAGAGRTDRPGRGTEMLRHADRCFRTYRNYYHALIEELRPAGRAQLSLPQVGELYGRYFACAVAELEANFLLPDLRQWHCRHEAICRQLAVLSGLDVRQMLRDRVDALGLTTDAEREEMADQAVRIRDTVRESHDRIVTAGEEARWLARRRLAPGEYLRCLGDVEGGDRPRPPRHLTGAVPGGTAAGRRGPAVERPPEGRRPPAAAEG